MGADNLLPSAAMQLSLDRIEAPGATRSLVLIHGILGSGANLRTLGRRFVEAAPGWSAVLVDLPAHGRSADTHAGSLEGSARIVLDALSRELVPRGAVLGHSFGGKVALEMLRQAGRMSAVAHTVVVDSTPGRREAPYRGAATTVGVIDMLDRLQPTFASRAAFIDAVVAEGQPRSLAEWLAMSLEREPTQVRFGLDLGEIRRLLESYFATDLWPVVEEPPGDAEVHLVVGDRSTSFDAADRERAAGLSAAPRARVTVDVLPAGHWVHVDDPEGLLRVLLSRVAKIG